MSERFSTEGKSSDRLVFEHYLRTGERLSVHEWTARYERKFNPYHDERGRFTFATGAARMGEAPDAGPTTTRPRATPPGARRTVSPRPTAPRTRIASMPGFPETQRTAWRSSNDAAFIAAADFYNRKYGLKPGDRGFRTPEFLKAWAMRESGGEGNEHAFRTDPFQVNNAGDWAPEKQRIAGLRQGQRMTPEASAYSALEWLRFKSLIHDKAGNVVKILDDQEALKQYNTVKTVTRQSYPKPHKEWYAETIIQMAKPMTANKK